MSDMIIPGDRKTRLAVQATYIRQALEALRRALVLETDDAWQITLRGAAAELSIKQGRITQEYAEIREREARTAAAALEG